jgi:Mrp family chromosome partitioning ATPase
MISFEDLKQNEEERKIKQSLYHIHHKWVVMSGKGGVGKSSLAINLAVGLSLKGYDVGLMDVDLHGPSIPRMLGLSALAPIRPEEAAIYPLRFRGHLKVISIEALMSDKDTAVIWRGPLKIGIIRRFIADVNWGTLNFLIIDSPPGTGDEPLTIAQTIPDAQAIIVTTPQDISLADARKSINFCRQVDMAILGIIENMSGFTCPHCGKETALFKKDGGRRLAIATGHPFLGSVPLDMGFMEKGDQGEAYLLHDPAPAVETALDSILENLLGRLHGQRRKQRSSGKEGGMCHARF